MQTIILMKDNQSKQQNDLDFLFTVDELPESIQPKLLPFAQILNLETIDRQQLKLLLARGIPEQAEHIRQYVWKIALNYLPKNRKKWREQIHSHNLIYQQLIEQYLSKNKYAQGPFIPNKADPTWKHYENDFQLWEQIEKDTCRTQSQLSFFSTPAPAFPLPFLTNTRKEKCKLISGGAQPSNLDLYHKVYRYDYMTRILFIFGRLNPKINYVQGMNQLIAPIFYLLNHRQPHNAPIQQAACFFMLNNVMSDILEMHMRDFSLKENQVNTRLQLISVQLLAISPKTWQKLDSLKVEPFYYCFRWITLLFSQEFEMFDTLRLWESIFAHDDRTSYTNFFALALILSVREAIAVLDYSQIMALLKTISQKVKLEETIKLADQLYTTYHLVDLTELAEKNRSRLSREKENVGGGRLTRFLKKFF